MTNRHNLPEQIYIDTIHTSEGEPYFGQWTVERRATEPYIRATVAQQAATERESNVSHGELPDSIFVASDQSGSDAYVFETDRSMAAVPGSSLRQRFDARYVRATAPALSDDWADWNRHLTPEQIAEMATVFLGKDEPADAMRHMARWAEACYRQKMTDEEHQLVELVRLARLVVERTQSDRFDFFLVIRPDEIEILHNAEFLSVSQALTELRSRLQPAPPQRPTVVCLCGSTRFWREYQRQGLAETMAGNIVLSIGAATGTDDEHFGNLPAEEYERVKSMLDELHLRKIDMADEVFILNVDGYVGDSTRREIIYASLAKKPIRWLEPDKKPDWFVDDTPPQRPTAEELASVIGEAIQSLADGHIYGTIEDLARALDRWDAAEAEADHDE